MQHSTTDSRTEEVCVHDYFKKGSSKAVIPFVVYPSPDSFVTVHMMALLWQKGDGMGGHIHLWTVSSISGAMGLSTFIASRFLSIRIADLSA